MSNVYNLVIQLLFCINILCGLQNAKNFPKFLYNYQIRAERDTPFFSVSGFHTW